MLMCLRVVVVVTSQSVMGSLVATIRSTLDDYTDAVDVVDGHRVNKNSHDVCA